VLALAVLLGFGVMGCSAAKLGKSASLMRVSERDFKITAPKTIRSGDVRLRVGNRGPDTHELLVIRSDGRPLPLRKDGLTVDEDAVEAETITTIEGFERESNREVRLHLPPGRFVLICNMAGHYLAGMHATLVVRG
jgi:uncharacterized cupredoxin-like copper-binding protein